MALRGAFQRSAALCPAEASHAAGPRKLAVSAPAAARNGSRRRQFGEVSLPAARRRGDLRLSAIISAPGGGLEGALGPDGKRPNETQLRANLDAIVAPVQQDMAVMETNVKALVGERHPMLLAAAEQIFGAGGKKLRPVLCFLVARATAVAMGLPCVSQRGTSRGPPRVARASLGCAGFHRASALRACCVRRCGRFRSTESVANHMVVRSSADFCGSPRAGTSRRATANSLRSLR